MHLDAFEVHAGSARTRSRWELMLLPDRYLRCDKSGEEKKKGKKNRRIRERERERWEKTWNVYGNTSSWYERAPFLLNKTHRLSKSGPALKRFSVFVNPIFRLFSS